MDIVRFTTSRGCIDVTSDDLAAQTSHLTDLELIAYAVNYFTKCYGAVTIDVQSVQIIAR